MTAPAFRSGLIYLGWHYADRPDPGPPPRRPVPPEPERLNPGWLAAQRREARLLSRPAKLAAAACGSMLAAVLLLGRAGLLNPALTGLVAAAFAVPAVLSGGVAWRGNRALRAGIAAEQQRVAAVRASQERGHTGSLADHAAWFRAWQVQERSFARQPQWSPVALPGGIDRVDVAGGTLAGWSALLTMIAMPRLAAGGEVTVLDLSEGAVARDLVALAEGLGIGPLVWLLPSDLPRFDLGVGLPARELADVLTATAAAGAGGSRGHDAGGSRGHDPAADHAILERVLGVLADGATIAQVMAALRALGQVGDPRVDVSAGLLTAAQLEGITCLFGRGAADRVVTERAWALEARLRVLESLGTRPARRPASRLRVAALERGGGTFGNTVLAAYATVALTQLLRQARPGRPWHHTVCLAGADRLPGDVLDRLAAACEATRTGLVLAYRCAPGHVRERLGRGNAALAVMRLGNSDDAKAVSEQIGTQHRFVISQFTDTVGASVTDSIAASYTSTAGGSDSVSTSVSISQTSGHSSGRGHSRAGAAPLAPRTHTGSREASESLGTSDSESITEGISTSTSWGLTTSRAAGTSESLARTRQRSREFLVEPHELQQLPVTAVIVSYAAPGGRQVVLADANPAILVLPDVSLDVQPPPNLGPPPAQPDWRTHPAAGHNPRGRW